METTTKILTLEQFIEATNAIGRGQVKYAELCWAQATLAGVGGRFAASVLEQKRLAMVFKPAKMDGIIRDSFQQRCEKVVLEMGLSL